MKKKIDSVYFFERGKCVNGYAKTGVSLHCHTLHSKELLDFVPYYASRIPVAAYFWRRHMKRSRELYGSQPDFSAGHWTPPLTGSEVFASEKANLADLGLDTVVSITDHDSISANVEVRANTDSGHAPISLEWTVPFEEGFFHLGVHNLPTDEAEAISTALLDYTHSKDKSPNKERLHELLKMLNELPEVLVVLNHPIWDIEMIGQIAHERLLVRFLAEYARWVHAIEINGFRSWRENQAAAELAESLDLPVVSGGDRHCLQPNAMVNLTDASGFPEFVHEVRYDRYSRIVVMPEYGRPLPCRQLDSIKQILGRYDHFPEGRKHWSDRVYLDYKDGNGLRSLNDSWNRKVPIWTIPAFLALEVLTHPAARTLVGLLVGDRDIGRDNGTSKNQGFQASRIAASISR